MKKGIIKWCALGVFAATGAYFCLRAPETVESFLPQVETIRLQNSVYSETVLANGSISYTDNWYVNAAVSESDIKKIQLGQTAMLTGAAFDSGIYTATVYSVSPTARQNFSGTVIETVVDIVLTIDNPDENLRSGYTAQAIVKTSKEREIGILPYEAIGQDEIGEYVYVYEGGRAVRRDIETGAELGDGTEIVKGVDALDEVIASPEGVEAGTLLSGEEKR